MGTIFHRLPGDSCTHFHFRTFVLLDLELKLPGELGRGRAEGPYLLLVSPTPGFSKTTRGELGPFIPSRVTIPKCIFSVQ